jgi:hypothetical protein
MFVGKNLLHISQVLAFLEIKPRYQRAELLPVCRGWRVRRMVTTAHDITDDQPIEVMEFEMDMEI